jgi:drug/metabolite transporter (DMT)-like permease
VKNIEPKPSSKAPQASKVLILKMHNTHQLRNFFFLLLLSCCWGPSFLFIKIAVEYVPPITITAIRMMIGSALLYIILKFNKIDLPKFDKNWKHFLVMAIFSCGLPFTMFGVGEQYVDSSLAAIINGTSPLFTLAIAHYCTDNDRLNRAKIFGSAIGFFGLFLLVFPSLFQSKATVLGIISCLIASVSYAIGFVYAKKHIRGYKPLVVPCAQLLVASIILVPMALIFEKPYEIEYVSMPAIFSVLALSLIGSALAFVLYYKLISIASATYAASVNYIIPVIGVILGMIVLNEAMTWNSYIGSMMILSGVLIANGVITIARK